MTKQDSPWTRDRNCFSCRFKIDPARKEEFFEAFQELCTKAEDYYRRGCSFAFQGFARDPNELVIFASWDETVVKELRAQDWFQRCMQNMMECCDGPVIMEQYNGINKDRSVFDAYPAGKSTVHARTQSREVVFL